MQCSFLCALKYPIAWTVLAWSLSVRKPLLYFSYFRNKYVWKFYISADFLEFLSVNYSQIQIVEYLLLARHCVSCSNTLIRCWPFPYRKKQSNEEGRHKSKQLPYNVMLKHHHCGFSAGSDGKNLPALQETWVWSLGWEDPLEKDMATTNTHCAVPSVLPTALGIIKILCWVWFTDKRYVLLDK